MRRVGCVNYENEGGSKVTLGQLAEEKIIQKGKLYR